MSTYNQNHGTSLPQQNQHNIRNQYPQRYGNTPLNIYGNFYPHPFCVYSVEPPHNMMCFQGNYHSQLDQNLLPPHTSYGQLPYGNQNFTDKRSIPDGLSAHSNNEQTVSVEFKSAISKTASDVPKTDVKDIKNMFIAKINDVAHKDKEDTVGAVVPADKNVEKLVESFKNQNGQLLINSQEPKAFKDVIASAESTTHHDKAVTVDSKKLDDIPSAQKIDKIQEGTNDVSHTLENKTQSEEKPVDSSLCYLNVSKSGISRISYALGDLLEYSGFKESMTLKSLNAIRKYVVCLKARDSKSRRVSYKRSENSFISHKERINNLSDSQALVERFKIIVRTSLNKLTAQNISFVRDELAKLKYEDSEMSDFMADSLVRSVTKNMNLIVHYAHLTAKLLESIIGNCGDSVSLILKNKILEKCRRNLEINTDWLQSYEILKSRKITTLVEHDLLNEELLETEESQRKVHLGTITFLSHLLKLHVLESGFAMEVLGILSLNTHEFILEMLCKFLTLYGKELEEINKSSIIETFKKIEKIIPECPKRLQFLLEDVVVLRKEHWKIGGSEFQPKKFQQLRTTEHSVYTPQRGNTHNKQKTPSSSFLGPVSRSNDQSVKTRSYFSNQKTSSKSVSTYSTNKYGSLASDVSDPETHSFHYNKRGSNQAKFTGLQTNKREFKSVGSKSYSTSDERVFSSIKNSTADISKTTSSEVDNMKELKKTLEQIIYEYSLSLDTSVILGRLTEIDIIQYMKVFVEVAFILFIEKKTSGHRFLGDLLVVFFRQKRIDKASLMTGFKNFCNYAEMADLEVDVPMLWSFVGAVICPLIYSADLALYEFMETVAGYKSFDQDVVVSGLLNTILKTTSKRTLYLLCQNEEFLGKYRRSESLRQMFPFLERSMDNLDSVVALQQVFSQSSVAGVNSRQYTFEENKVNSEELLEFSRIVYSMCPSGPCELIKSYTDELCSTLKDSRFQFIDSSHIIQFFDYLCKFVAEQDNNPSSFISELLESILVSKIIDEPLANQIRSTTSLLL